MQDLSSTVFIGDNLDILRGIDSDSVDLVYLDPPFNSNKTYSAPIGSEAAGAAFKDFWTLSDVDLIEHNRLKREQPWLYALIYAAGKTHSKGMFSYLMMMSSRLFELKRVLKPTGSLYLHCDPTASHYLKLVMDGIFGNGNFEMKLRGNVLQVTIERNGGDLSTTYFCSIVQVENSHGIESYNRLILDMLNGFIGTTTKTGDSELVI